MPVNFNAPSFTELTLKEKKEIVLSEFKECRNDFSYYVNNYAMIRHPNAGLIKMDPFDYQIDVSVPIAQTLISKRSKETLAELKKYKFKFDYEKWWNELAEEKIELSKKVPVEFHNFHKVTSKSEEYSMRVDTILLKSRQTGLSVIFQQLGLWHVNFHNNVYDLILSQTDREAKKFLNNVISSYELIPPPLRSKKLNANEHELWVSVSGSKSMKSGIQALPPTSDAGRSYDPNLVVLDEFAMYAKAEDVWTAISMSVSAGGIIVIISTPRGVGNLYHKIWEATSKSLSFTVTNPILQSKEEEEAKNLSVFRPMVVHWSQLPEIEFKRRGFENAIDWYNHMKAKISMQKGEKAVAQELDLDFLTSGNTINSNVIKKLRATCLEIVNKNITILETDIPGLIVYTPPKKGREYVIGVDTAEGVFQDYSVLHVWELPDEEVGGFPIVAAKWANNSKSIRQFKDIVKNTGLFYNEAWLHIERNNHGHVLLSYFIEENDYNEDKIYNKYDAVNAVFMKRTKGWNSQTASRTLLITTLIDFFTTYQNDLHLPLDTIDELKTFVQSANGRWDAQSGYHDDHIISIGLTLLAWKLLPKYKLFLLDNSDSAAVTLTDIPDDTMMMSSTLIMKNNELNNMVEKKEKPLRLSKDVDIDALRDKFQDNDIKNIIDNRPKTLQQEQLKQQYLSTTIDYDDSDDIMAF